MELVRSAFAPVPILTAPYFEQEVVGPEMLDRLGRRAVRRPDPPSCCSRS
jgi:arsenite-transporting ATPase